MASILCPAGNRGAILSKDPALSNQPCVVIQGCPAGSPHSRPAMTPQGTGTWNSRPWSRFAFVDIALEMRLKNWIVVDVVRPMWQNDLSGPIARQVRKRGHGVHCGERYRRARGNVQFVMVLTRSEETSRDGAL